MMEFIILLAGLSFLVQYWYVFALVFLVFFVFFKALSIFPYQPYRYNLKSTKEREESRRLKKNETEEERFETRQRRWEDDFKVYVDSEMLKGVSQADAEQEARDALGQSPEEQREAAEKQRIKRELEEERLQRNKEILAKRAKLDARLAKKRGMSYAEVSDSSDWSSGSNTADAPSGLEWLDEFLALHTDVERDSLPGGMWWRYSTDGKPFCVIYTPADGAPGTDHRLLTIRYDTQLMTYLRSNYTGMLPRELIDGEDWVMIDLEGDATDELLRALCDCSREIVRRDG